MPDPLRRPLSRRAFAGLLLAGLAPRGRADDRAEAGRRLDFVVADAFGRATPENVEAVVRSAAETLWAHCPHTRWTVPGFHIYATADAPITLHDHRPDGRIAIGLATRDTYWAQYAFQFAHEFGHALAGHSNDWRQLEIRAPRPHHWLEEALCETASLFALRAMSDQWRRQPPYANWRPFSAALADYATERMGETTRGLPPGFAFVPWFRAEEASLRADAVQREKNNRIALQLLPLFEAEPAGWESLTCYNRSRSAPDQTLAARFADWIQDAPPAQRGFIGRLGARFGVAPAPAPAAA